jgi:hypothetical protein
MLSAKPESLRITNPRSSLLAWFVDFSETNARIDSRLCAIVGITPEKRRLLHTFTQADLQIPVAMPTPKEHQPFSAGMI